MPHRLFPLLFLLALSASPTWAGGTVQLELVGAGQSSALSFQEWSQTLGKAGIRNVRIRSGGENDRPSIDVQGTAENPLYLVVGVINSRNEIEVPGARFRRTEVAKLSQWLKDLAERGPTTGKEPKVPFGLSVAEFNRVAKELAAPVGFATQGTTCKNAVEKIAGQFQVPLKLDADAARGLADVKLEDEFTDLSAGVALACMLRAAGYGFVPRKDGGQLVYAVVKEAGREVWPIGRTTDKPDNEAVPALYEFRNVNIQNVSAAKAIDAIGRRLKTPIVFDRAALALHHIDPAKVSVSVPGKRTTYSIALKRLLFQARLKYEVRYDEAGKPFVWITTIKAA